MFCFGCQRAICGEPRPVLEVVLFTGTPFRAACLERVLVTNHLALKVCRQSGVIFRET